MNANFAFTLKLLCHFVTPLLSTEEELVLLAEDGELLSSPSVYRGKSPGKRGQTKSLLGICRTKGGLSPFRAQYPEGGRELKYRVLTHLQRSLWGNNLAISST